MSRALGLIEAIGLPAAIEAADTAVKSANVKLSGYELTRGGGLVVVKLTGDVGAVKAAVAAGAAAAEKVGKVWATHVIPRPHQSTEEMVYPSTPETTGCSAGVSPTAEIPVEVPVKGEKLPESVPEPVFWAGEAKEEEQAGTIPAGEGGREKPSDRVLGPREVCNLCGDPLCPRKKGEPKMNCLHYKDKEAEA
ncbi:MAG: BMC domain-containing protein [Bacillota bacterium]|uniref:BMC domain-containing protein n=1 Tax=Thermanaerosceptrum fracticalcis TaxID=1712410 RepID=A0A7G6E7F2_THEFR|nr:BMC domain-containing protein [Thermanaerosceptrum fracticalcis]QNB48006.1 BMC domain-containing protein [Thermanaerosceptrum fracticalcis]